MVLGLIGFIVWLLISHRKIGVLFIISLCVLFAMFIHSWKPIYVTRTPLFAADVKKAISSEDLQKWAIEMVKQVNAKTNSDVEIQRELVPMPIRELNSQGSPFQWATFHPADEGKEPYLTLWWGGGFGHWGVDVGSESFRISEDDDNYVIEWKPGVYFWHQKH
jgi:hypothetical protein